jgi:hypothetical protein
MRGEDVPNRHPGVYVCEVDAGFSRRERGGRLARNVRPEQGCGEARQRLAGVSEGGRSAVREDQAEGGSEVRRRAGMSNLAAFAFPGVEAAALPAALQLLELCPGTLKRAYARNAGGGLLHREDGEGERVLEYGSGLRCAVRVEGSRRDGLPNQNDVDYLLALFRLHEAVALDRGGVLLEPSYRALSVATGRTARPAGPQCAAIERALRRWSQVRISVVALADYGRRLSPSERSGGVGAALREAEAVHGVLSFRAETVSGAGLRCGEIALLRLDPVWLDRVDAGISRWIDVATHARLPSGAAKRLYQLLAIRTARCLPPPHIWTSARLRAELGAAPAHGAGRLLRTIRTALAALTAEGVVARFELNPAGAGEHTLVVWPGERLAAAGDLRQAGRAGGQARLLVRHLEGFGIPKEVSEQMVAERPTQALSALRRAYYLQIRCGGWDGGELVADWGAWLVRAVREGGAVADAGFLAWLDEEAGGVRLEGEGRRGLVETGGRAQRPVC